MNKLLVVVGPTAVGKTELALNLANKFKGELVSADSRQVYKELNIGTGKDLPPGADPTNINGYPVYEIEGIPVWGYDLVEPQEDYDVSQYIESARDIISYIWEKDKLPILVGGTGFYVHALLRGIETINIKPNKALRRQLDSMQIEDLFEILARLDATKAASLNTSDRKNRVRLVRAIEIADAKIRGKDLGKKTNPLNADTLKIGIMTDKENLNNSISQRVRSRVESGIEEEIKRILASNVTWKDQSMTSLGYREWKEYFSGKKKLEEIIEEWTRNEQKYAKRQITWFKRDREIIWFDPKEEVYLNKVELKVQKWYSSIKDENSKD